MGRQFDSSRTRVAPVFQSLSGWVPRLLALATHGPPDADGFDSLDLFPAAVDFGDRERRIPAPKSLLEWLVRNVKAREQDPDTSGEARENRAALFRRDAAAIDAALERLSAGQLSRGWHVFEGPTAPDVYIESRDAIIVIEGKRTEAGPTIDTEWVEGRHQMWRHIDAIWELRGDRRVFGLFIVEGDNAGDVPGLWQKASTDTWSGAVIESSLPHRAAEEREQLRRCFLGVTTWQKVATEFNLSDTVLPHTMTDTK